MPGLAETDKGTFTDNQGGKVMARTLDKLDKMKLPEVVTQIKDAAKYTGGADIVGFIDSYQAAKELNICFHTFQNYIRAGRLPAQKIGKKWRISLDVWDRFKRGEFVTNIENAPGYIMPGNSRTNEKLLTRDEMAELKLVVSRAREQATEPGDVEVLETISRKLEFVKTC